MGHIDEKGEKRANPQRESQSRILAEWERRTPIPGTRLALSDGRTGSITLRSAQRKRGRGQNTICGKISLYHQVYERWKVHLRLPIEFGTGHGGIRTQIMDFT